MVNYGFLSPYPPTQTGTAAYCAALLHHLQDPAADERCGIVRVVSASPEPTPGDTAMRLVNDRPVSTLRAIDALNEFDVLIVQHEYDIYGGRDGEDVLDVLAGVDKPVICVLHTVLAAPTPHQHQVLQRIIDASSALVVLSRTAALTLVDKYRIDARRVSTIPHGAATTESAPPSAQRTGPPTILTWGLLGPSKGIEWAIAALGQLHDLNPAPVYLVAGQTHPEVFAEQGEYYRSYLQEQAERFGVTNQVVLDAAYRTPAALSTLVHQADLVLLPYDAAARTDSEVLVEAVAARRPVVATDFPHARELLADGVGLVVPHHDPLAMAHAIRRVLTEPGLAAEMTARCASLAPILDWNAVATGYRSLARAILAGDASTGSKTAGHVAT